ncbi:MAG: PQQ-binding-like beta-propeller repeat protein [Planctomycetaceae bacterium]
MFASRALNRRVGKQTCRVAFCAWAAIVPAAASCSETSAPVTGIAVASTESEQAAANRQGDDWPEFLGHHADGRSDETGFADTWPKDGPPVLWEKTVGTGYSAPSVHGNRLVLHHRVGEKEVVECLRADTGDQIWEFAYGSNFTDPYGYNNGPRCTPLLTPERCYTFGAEGMLLCLSLDKGSEIWRRDTEADFNVPEWFFGVGCTPILEDGLLIVLVGGQPNSGVVAFDAQTGKTVWQHVGQETWDGCDTRGQWRGGRYKWTGKEKVVSYSSPIAATIRGKRHVLCLMRHGLVSLDPKDGSENFKYWFRSQINDSVNAARPVVIGDRIFLSAAYEVGSAMLQVAPDGKSVTELWRDRDNMLTHWSTAIEVDGYIYGFSGRHEYEGTLRCLDAKTGKVVWQTKEYQDHLELLRRNAQTHAIVDFSTGEAIFGRGSKIKVEDKFIVLGEFGTLALIKINPQRYEELSRTSYRQIHTPAWTAPVLSRKRLYLRCEDALLCLDLAKPAAEK